ncbi:hypothetical protein J7J84_07705 [bacterium]|nr:hypothetical protein [bacterium]
MDSLKDAVQSWEEASITPPAYITSYAAALAYLEDGGRLLAAGGVTRRAGRDGQALIYTVMPEKLDKLLSVDGSQFEPYHNFFQGNFGYVRGEHMGGDEKSAFLWMYGMRDPLAPGRHRGLDVLNAETGELVPDGIPDGICILYELRDGEVVNVTRAEDM